ncbi:hypothetical protein JTB14_018150 [Gonioctena quinquepunctata]|nr:hypothetical protein JTB14_018150 [Gonioctena quinquepunctata]
MKKNLLEVLITVNIQSMIAQMRVLIIPKMKIVNACILMVFLSEDVHGVKWIQLAPCSRWAHEDCVGIEDMVDFYVCGFCTTDKSEP